MDPLAEELNQRIQEHSPTTFELLSQRGRALYFPRGILSQTAEAKAKAHRFNATIGEATEGDGPMALPSILSHIQGIAPADALRYAPAAGKPELRQAWREKLLAENPLMRERQFGLPIVTSAITHGLSLVGDLFVDPGDRLLLPDKLWGNYRLTYEVRLGARVETFPSYDGERFNVGGLRRALMEYSGKTILLLNFPNNPTGYMPGAAEVEGIRDAVVEAAESGSKLLVVIDDAYFGLVYEEHGFSESPFGVLANLHPNVLTIKLDGATKELFVWGLRCGFLTFGPPPVEQPEPLLGALERKIMGAIRGGISNCSHLSQSLVLAALRSPSIDEERRAKFELLRSRAQRVKQVVYRERYRSSWDVYPFNAGYFMCIRVKGVDAEALRTHLLSQYGVGVISIGQSDIRVAFSCLEASEVEPLFDCIHEAMNELRQ
ncbi:MAG: aminotransferase class I/II-fold pyridoxal phosphate-dependent enzyme [Deltaproteobacteria bacterium]|nr:aminotransferase class I/II-fold pyridoxal phosphate-dependent enzyme [Deltaproteobacteria bacterium]